MHRLFIAIDFPDETREALANLCFGVPAAKWVSKDQLHLTLRFVGDADDDLFSQIQEALYDVNASQFSLTLKGVGYFPPHRKPNVLWVGIEPSEELARLRDSIEALLEELGLQPEERKYHPHLTLARLLAGSPARQNNRIPIRKQPVQGGKRAGHRISPVFQRAHAGRAGAYD